MFLFLDEKTTKQRKHDNDGRDTESFYSMPDEIIELIFDALDLPDCKSLAESCSRFNRIFSEPKYTNKLQLRIRKEDLSSEHLETTENMLKESQRVYTNFVLDRYDKLASLPMNIMEFIIPRLEHLKVELTILKKIPFDRENFPEKILIDVLLPHFANMTHLEYESNGTSVAFSWMLVNSRYSPTVNFERVDFKHLKYLKIDIVLLEYLDTYYADFSTESLQELILYGCPSDPTDDNEGKIRKLIAKQKGLKVLSMDVNSVFFDKKFDISSKLKKLELTKHLKMNQIQGENFMDFYDNQKELEVLKINVEIEESNNEGTRRLKKLQQDRLDMKFKKLQIIYEKEGGMNLNSANKLMLTSRPNFTVEELEIVICLRDEPEDISGFLSLAASKFPNVKRLEISHDRLSKSSRPWKFPTLENLKNLTHLSIIGQFCCCLQSITIPHLQCFAFEYSLHTSNPDSCLIDQLIIRHSELKKLKVFFNTQQANAHSFTNFFECTLKNSINLSLITVEENQQGHWTENQIETICDLMKNYSRPGFHFKTTFGPELLKRDDTKIVRKYEGRWKSYDKIDV